jgi:hypothetical protein
LQKLRHHGRLRHLTGPDHTNNPVPFKKNVHLGQLLVSLDHGRDRTLKIRLPTPSFQAASSSCEADNTKRPQAGRGHGFRVGGFSALN